MHLTNQRPGKPDMLSQGAYTQTIYPRVQWENTLDKRGDHRTPKQAEILGAEREESRSNNRGECKVKEQEQEHMTTHAAGN